MRTVCITGASSGIGEALAIHYAREENSRLLLIGRNQQRLNGVAARCRAEGADTEIGLFDVTEAQAFGAWLEQQDQRQPIDLLIINTGLSTTQAKREGNGLFHAESLLVQVHLQGLFNTLHPVLSRMKQRSSGQIALMSSMNAFISLPRNPVYGAVKAAIFHYGLALRNQLENSIKVSVICPGWIDTPLTAINRFRMPFLRDVKYAVKKITVGLAKNKAVIAFPWQLKCLLCLYNLLPLVLRQRIARQFSA